MSGNIKDIEEILPDITHIDNPWTQDTAPRVGAIGYSRPDGKWSCEDMVTNLYIKTLLSHSRRIVIKIDTTDPLPDTQKEKIYDLSATLIALRQSQDALEKIYSIFRTAQSELGETILAVKLLADNIPTTTRNAITTEVREAISGVNNTDSTRHNLEQIYDKIALVYGELKEYNVIYIDFDCTAHGSGTRVDFELSLLEKKRTALQDPLPIGHIV